MTFQEAVDICNAENNSEFQNIDYYGQYYYGGWDWMEWPEKTQQSIERDDIIGNFFWWDSYARRPYYRMRGKPVTEEQAKEIILRTSKDFENKTGDISSLNFDNWWLQKSHSPFGWCHPDGTIGVNGMMQKWPNAEELLNEFFVLACEFPFLDLMIVITDIDEINFRYDMINGKLVRNYSIYGGDAWRKLASIGVHLCGGKFELLDKNTALRLYDEYCEKYEIKGIKEGDVKNDIYDIDHYSEYRENLRKLYKYDYLMEQMKERYECLEKHMLY